MHIISRSAMRSLAASLSLLALAVPASAPAFELHVSGPRNVTIGEEVRFPTTGFKPN